MRQFMTVSALALSATCANATEVTSYGYDALGRLVSVASSGSINNGRSATVTFDPAGNRTNYSVNGAGPVIPTISIGNATAVEGAPLTFSVSLSAVQTSVVTVNYASSAGSAVAGSDYATVSGQLTIPAGQVSGVIIVQSIDDSVAESTENFTLALTSPTSGVSLGSSTGTGTITDNDAPASIAIAGGSAVEGGTVSFTVTRSGNLGVAVTANYVTASGTATSGIDFAAASGQIAFAANQTSANLSVTTIDDSLSEGTESFSVSLASPSSGAVISTGTASGSIIDNDGLWSSSLTAGVWNFCYLSCTNIYGYLQGLAGSLSNSTFGAYQVTGVYSVNNASIVVSFSGSAIPPNSGWSSITVPGVGALSRTAATYSPGSNSASWTWISAANITSGNVSIQ